MERGASFSRYQRHPDSTFGLSSDPPNDPNPTGSDPCQNLSSAVVGDTTVTQPPPPPCMVREQDQYMPIANVIRIMRRILPAHAKISDDAKETIQECVSEYISFVTGEANERCQREQRKTITAEDVLWAMGKLGFDDYVEPLTMFLNRYREFESDRGPLRTDPPFKPAGFHGSPVGVPFAYGMLDPSIPMSGYYQNGPGQAGGSSSSQPGMPIYDPFAQFK